MCFRFIVVTELCVRYMMDLYSRCLIPVYLGGDVQGKYLTGAGCQRCQDFRRQNGRRLTSHGSGGTVGSGVVEIASQAVQYSVFCDLSYSIV